MRSAPFANVASDFTLYQSSRDDMSSRISGKDASARATFDKYDITLKFSCEAQCLQIHREKKGTASVVSIPVWSIVNIEDAKEAIMKGDERRMCKLSTLLKKGGSNDSSTKEGPLQSLTADTGECDCKGQFISNDNCCRNPIFCNTSLSSTPVLPCSKAVDEVQYGENTYFLYYMKTRGRKLSTVKLKSVADPTRRDELHEFLSMLLSCVYPRGYRKLLFFLNPKSGNGNSLSIFKRYVLQILRFSRHQIQVIITKHARNAEDYVADLKNDIDARHVIVAVGGDGTLHEIINGLTTRQEAAFAEEGKVEEAVECPKNLTRASPSTAGEASVGYTETYMGQQRVTTLSSGQEDVADGKMQSVRESALSSLLISDPPAEQVAPQYATLPLIATVPTGSGCGLARSLNVIDIKTSVLALVHLHTCLKKMMFVEYKTADCVRNRKYATKNEVERGERRDRVNSVDAPQVVNGKSEPTKDDDEYIRRIACLSSTFGVVNEIDRGSEKLRCLGNSRFTVYAAYLLLRGLRKYPCRLRYLPWTGERGQQLQKIDLSDPPPTVEEYPICTFTNQCPHCVQHGGGEDTGPNTYSTAAPNSHFDCRNDDVAEVGNEQKRRGEGMEGEACVPGRNNPSHRVQPQEKQAVDFKDDGHPWVELEGKFVCVFISNVPDASADVRMTPYAHLNDGSIDIAFVMEKSKKVGRRDFLDVFTRLEKGDHVCLPVVSYVKARAVELEAIEGNIMVDGEMMPMDKIRIGMQKQMYEMVRGP